MINKFLILFFVFIIGLSPAFALSEVDDSLDVVTFKEKLQKDYMTRKVTYDNVYIPSFFTKADTLQPEDFFYELDLYNYKEICVFWGVSSSNALCFDDEFPSEGTLLDYKTSISRITYYSKRGIFSGFTSDGRVFYMKKRILKDVCPHPIFYGIIYPKSYNDAVKIIINHIKDWTPDYTYDDMDSYYLRHLE